ncbi:NUDIX domain-containing protein [Streptomyces violascens]|uniref:NUDIX domain-containing protein n=1 Tax=Streptomyces violascens TaxID=67381 RepID=UPI0037B1FD2D
MTETVQDTTVEQETADVICIKGGEILMVVRGWAPFKGKLALPGGFVERGEQAPAAAVRELLEETHVRVAEEDLLKVGVYNKPGRDPRGRFSTTAYVVTVPDTTTAQAGDDAAAVRWLSIKDLPADLAFDHNQIVSDALQHLLIRPHITP